MNSSSRRVKAAIAGIIQHIERVASEWKNVYGWAPTSAADLLDRSRLDRLASLSRCLPLWLEPVAEEEDKEGRLILAWANLGALVEGMMKFFLSVYHLDYSKSPATRGKSKTPIDPDKLQLETLRQFFCKEVWEPVQQKRWKGYVELVQNRRNAIHAYKDRDIGTFHDFGVAIVDFRAFLLEAVGNLPDSPPRENE